MRDFVTIIVSNSGFFKVLADAAGDAEHSVKKEVLALSALRESPRLLGISCGCMKCVRRVKDVLNVPFATARTHAEHPVEFSVRQAFNLEPR